MINHQLGQLFPTNQYDLLFNPTHVISRFLGKLRCGYQNTLSCPLPFEAARKGLHNWPSDSRFPSLGLEINNVKTKFILFDNAVYSTITALTYCLASIFP